MAAKKGGLLSAIKSDVEKTGQNRGKFFYVKSGAKARIRFLEDADDGRKVLMHDRWEPQLKVPCRKNIDEDAECQYCDMEGVRSRTQYAWSVWDYEANEVKIFMYAANNCSPVPPLAAMHEQFGNTIDRDYSIGRTGQGTNTQYSVIPLDKTKFRNEKAKPIPEKAFWKAVFDAFPAGDVEAEEPDEDETDDTDDDEDEDEKPAKKAKTKKPEPKKPVAKGKSKKDEDWDDDEEEDDEDDDWGEDEETDKAEEYREYSAKELYKMCKERGINVKPQLDKEVYVEKLVDDDLPF